MINKTEISGTKLVSEPKIGWRQGMASSLVDSAADIAAAKQDFNDRERKLVWQRLDLEAANLQKKELERIRTASELEEIPTILNDFEKEVRENMQNQKWGKEWLETKSPTYFTANKNDVATAFAGKKKELLSINMNKTLNSYAEQFADAPLEQQEVLRLNAYKMIDDNAEGLLSPSEKENTKAQFDRLLEAKSRDAAVRIKAEKEAQKLQQLQRIAELKTMAVDGTLTREQLDTEKQNGVFFYSPEKFNDILEYMNKNGQKFENDPEAVAYIKDNWENLGESDLQKFNLSGKINTQTYNHYSGMMSKRKKGNDPTAVELYQKAKSGEDISEDIKLAYLSKKIDSEQKKVLEDMAQGEKEKSPAYRQALADIDAGRIVLSDEIDMLELPEEESKLLKSYLKIKQTREQNAKKEQTQTAVTDLLNLARKGENVLPKVENLEVANEIDSRTATLIKQAYERQKTYSREYRQAIADIDAGKIGSDYEISRLNLPKNEAQDAKAYLKDKKDYEQNMQNSAFERLSKAVWMQEIVDKGTLAADVDWDKLSADQQQKLSIGVENRQKQVLARQKAQIYADIKTGRIRSQNEVIDAVMALGWGKEQTAEFEDLQKTLTLFNSDRFGVMSKAMDIIDKNFLAVFSNDNLTLLESEAIEKARAWVTDTYQKAVEQGLSPQALAEQLSPDKVLNFLNNVRPSREEVLLNVDGLRLLKGNLEVKRDELFNYDEKNQVYLPKSDTDIEDLFDFRNSLDAYVANGGSLEEAEKLKSQTDRAFLQKISFFDVGNDNKTILGEVYRTVNAKFGGNINLSAKAALIQEIGNQLRQNGIDFNQKRSWTDGQSFVVKIGKSLDFDGMVSSIVNNMMIRYVQSQNPGASFSQAAAIVNGTDIFALDDAKSTNPAARSLKSNIQSKPMNGRQVRVIKDGDDEYIF